VTISSFITGSSSTLPAASKPFSKASLTAILTARTSVCSGVHSAPSTVIFNFIRGKPAMLPPPSPQAFSSSIAAVSSSGGSVSGGQATMIATGGAATSCGSTRIVSFAKSCCPAIMR
jgi:hypothetical protein